MIEPGKYLTRCGLIALVTRIRQISTNAWSFSGSIYGPAMDLWFLHHWNSRGESISTDKDFDLVEKHGELDKKRVD